MIPQFLRQKPKLSDKDLAFLQAFAFSGKNEVWENVLYKVKEDFDAAVAEAIGSERTPDQRSFDAGYAKALVDFHNTLVELRRQALEINGVQG